MRKRHPERVCGVEVLLCRLLRQYLVETCVDRNESGFLALFASVKILEKLVDRLLVVDRERVNHQRVSIISGAALSLLGIIKSV